MPDPLDGGYDRLGLQVVVEHFLAEFAALAGLPTVPPPVATMAPSARPLSRKSLNAAELLVGHVLDQTIKTFLCTNRRDPAQHVCPWLKKTALA